MAETTLLRIKSVEAQARVFIKGAQNEAAQIIKRAEKEAANAFSYFSEICGQRTMENKRQAEKDAFANSQAFANETEDLCVLLIQGLLSQKQKAIQAIVEHIAE